MGRLNYDQSIEHFSHEHPLELSNIQQPSPNLSSCAGCNLKPSEWFYTCKACNYILHIQCSQIPQHIHHPADPNHALILQALPAHLQALLPTYLLQQSLLPYLSRPSYLERALPICDACGEHVKGFHYYCSSCDLVLHILCASMPPSVKHQSHSHPLKLTYNPPYQTKGFSCNICQKLGSKQWLYRCNACEFDAHLDCVTSKPRVSEIQHQIRAPQPQAPPPNYNSFPGSHQPQI